MLRTTEEKLNRLFDKSSVLYVLSCLMKNPLLIQNEKYPLKEDDFYTNTLKLIFIEIYNLANEGVMKITPADIERRIAFRETQYQGFVRNQGLEILKGSYNLSTDLAQFNHYYDIVKKFSILRSLECKGIDTSRFYNTEVIATDTDKQLKKLIEMPRSDIISYYREILVGIESANIENAEGGPHLIGGAMRQLLKDLKEHPEVGFPIDGDIVNAAVRGARPGKFYVFSAPSGEGKTRFLVSNACAMSMPRLTSDNRLEVRGSEDGDSYQKILYITTEQQFDEIESMMLAYVSGVDENKILLHDFTPEEEKKIELACQITEKYKSNFIVIRIADPSIELVKATLLKYIVQDKVQYIFYDYIFTSPSLTREFTEGVREDVALMMMSNTLKEIAAEHNIFLMSSTQLNDGWNRGGQTVGTRNQNLLRGSKAIADKVDCGLIGIKLRDDERQKIEAIWNEVKKRNIGKWSAKVLEKGPNQVIDIYKNRRGPLTGIKIFRYFDYGTCRAVDLFATSSSYNALQHDELEIDKYTFPITKEDFLCLHLMNVTGDKIEEEKQNNDDGNNDDNKKTEA